MATTTNYSWTTPDDTALVKDGAAAIRTLGSSADTTVKALNPGTTAGDIDYYTSSTTKARIAIGTANQQLRVNSGATAPEWFTPSSAGGMTLITTTTTNNTSNTVSFTSIPATYKHLLVIGQGLQNGDTTDDRGMLARINNDTGSNYAFQEIMYDNASATGYGEATGTSINLNRLTARGNDTSARFGNMVFWIYDYANTGVYKPLAFTGQATGNGIRFFMSGMAQWNDTSVINRVDFITTSNNFKVGTFRLYGVA